MNNFRSNSAVAAAVSLAIGAGVAAAATWTAGTAVYSQEYGALATASGGQSLVSTNGGQAPRFQVGAAYQTGDSVTVTLSGAEFATASSISVACDQTGGTSFTTTIGSSANVTLSATTATFSVAAAIPTGSQCQVAGGLVKNSTVAAVNTSGIKLALAVKRGADTTVDSAADTTVATVRETLLMAVATGTDRFDGRIMSYGGTAAGQNGRVFTGGGTTDTALINITMLDAVNDVSLSSGTAFTVTISSSAASGFGWVKNNAATSTVCDLDGANSATIRGGQGTLAAGDSSCTTLVYSSAASGIQASTADVTPVTTIDFTVSTAGNFMTAQTFSGSGTWIYSVSTNAATKPITLTAGAFTQNGARVFVPYMPVGSGISQVLTVSNNSAVAGTATISAIDSTGTACAASNFGTVTLTRSAVTSLSSALTAGIAACYGNTTSRSLALTVTVNAPAEGVEVWSSYNVSGNRVPVVNSSNGKGNANTFGVSTGNADY